MITEEEYKQWKPLIEEYEQYEIQLCTVDAMYCDECQALEPHDCFCDEPGTDNLDCNTCGGEYDHHYRGCPYNTDPFDKLITNGYD